MTQEAREVFGAPDEGSAILIRDVRETDARQ